MEFLILSSEWSKFLSPDSRNTPCCSSFNQDTLPILALNRQVLNNIIETKDKNQIIHFGGKLIFSPPSDFSLSAIRQDFSNPPIQHCKGGSSSQENYFETIFTIPLHSRSSLMIQEGDLLLFSFFNGNPFFNFSQVPIGVKVRNLESKDITLGSNMWISDLGLELTITQSLSLSVDKLVFTFQIPFASSIFGEDKDEIQKNFDILLSGLSCSSNYFFPNG